MKNGCFEGIKLFLFDMDGTLYIGNRLFDFTEETSLDAEEYSAERRLGTEDLF